MKYLLVDNEVIARQKSNAALEHRFPNRHTLQAQKHAENPAKYPATCASQHLHGWKKDELGRCEIEIDDGGTQYYPDDLNDLRNERAISVAQGPK